MAAPEEPSPSNLWDQICAEFEAEQPSHPDNLGPKQEYIHEQKQEPVFIIQVPSDTGAFPLLNEDRNKSATTDESFPQKTPSLFSLPPAPELPDLKTCSPREFLEHYIFPVLLPGIAELLLQAKKEKCFERKRTKFIALDFLTEWLFNHNAKRKDDPFVEFFEIPFVKDWLKDHPRPPIALSLLLTEEEASNIIQSFWRGYRIRRLLQSVAMLFPQFFADIFAYIQANLDTTIPPSDAFLTFIRCEPEVQELRQWQKHLRETKNIFKRVREFWAKQEKKVGTKLEDSVQPSPQRSKFSVLEILKTTEVMEFAPEVAAEVVQEQPSSLLGPSL